MKRLTLLVFITLLPLVAIAAKTVTADYYDFDNCIEEHQSQNQDHNQVQPIQLDRLTFSSDYVTLMLNEYDTYKGPNKDASVNCPEVVYLDESHTASDDFGGYRFMLVQESSTVLANDLPQNTRICDYRPVAGFMEPVADFWIACYKNRVVK